MRDIPRYAEDDFVLGRSPIRLISFFGRTMAEEATDKLKGTYSFMDLGPFKKEFLNLKAPGPSTFR